MLRSWEAGNQFGQSGSKGCGEFGGCEFVPIDKNLYFDSQMGDTRFSGLTPAERKQMERIFEGVKNRKGLRKYV